MQQKALEGMINNFGQTPCQLLKVGGWKNKDIKIKYLVGVLSQGSIKT